MPRPKDYTLATSTASDDFLLIDGATNGTRKLNAYSPTFGGNLTVGGTITLPSNNWISSGTNLIRDSYFGYSTSYRLIQVGTTGGISLGADLTGNAAGTFNGAEIIIPNNRAVIAPNAANNSYVGVLKVGSDNKVYLGGNDYQTLGAVVLNGTSAEVVGNLTVSGTGTSSVAGNLTVSGTASSFGGFANAGGAVYVRKDSGEVFRADAAGAGYRIVADQNGVDLGGARTTVGGNLGLGSAASSWGSGAKAIQGPNGSLAFYDGATDQLWLSQNAYWDGSWKYIANGFASSLQQYNGELYFYSAGSGSSGGSITLSEKLKLDASGNTTLAGNLTVSGTGNSTFAGNLGLGVTPSSWASGWNVLQPKGGSIGSNGANSFYINNNAYYDGSNWVYVASSDATRYAMLNSEHYWYNAASGTAGNVITFTERMKLDSSGNLYLGNSSASGNFYIGPAMISSNGGANPLKFGINATEQMRLFANGNLFIGASPVDGGQKLQVSGTAAISGAISIGNTVQTAAAVASTHKVTISIGGSTYYLLATNV